MRNLEAEIKLIRRLFQIAGAGFLLGLIALAIGTELIILDFWPESPGKFWCWQGVWVIVQSLIISQLAAVLKKI